MKNTITLEVVIKPQHIKIVQLLADGKSCPTISEELKINVRTLEHTISRMKEKYNAGSQAGLVAFFFRNNLIKVITIWTTLSGVLESIIQIMQHLMEE